jgi:hypothetical protein
MAVAGVAPRPGTPWLGTPCRGVLGRAAAASTAARADPEIAVDAEVPMAPPLALPGVVGSPCVFTPKMGVCARAGGASTRSSASRMSRAL